MLYRCYQLLPKLPKATKLLSQLSYHILNFSDHGSKWGIPHLLYFFIRAKMGDYEIWRETGQLASCCSSIYSFLLIWFIHWTFVKFCFQRFLTHLLSLSWHWWKCWKSMKTKSYIYYMNLWIKLKESYKRKCSKRPIGPVSCQIL